MSNAPDFTDALWEHAQHLLDATVAIFQQYEVDLPARRYIHVGTPAHDCPQVVVSFEQLYLGPPGDQAQLPHRCDAPRTSVFSVQIVRGVPTRGAGRATSAPGEDDLNDSSKQKLIDAWLLMDMGVNTADEWGIGALADVSPTEPQGGLQGMTLNIITSVP